MKSKKRKIILPLFRLVDQHLVSRESHLVKKIAK